MKNVDINYDSHETTSLSCNVSYTQLGMAGIRATN